MEILAFQIVIFLLIFIAGYSGLKSLNVVSLFLVLFTCFMVFTSKLMTIQFFTILIGYSLS
ncbi:MAG: hypothetical protein ABI793_01765, partial [Flavobacterium sp.]